MPGRVINAIVVHCSATPNGVALGQLGSVYVVKPGDTLSGIARRLYGEASAYTRLADANGIDPAALLPVGLKLRAPDATSADTLKASGRTAAQVIDGWHRARGFERSPIFRMHLNPHLGHIGYHYVIDVDGSRETGRDLDERGAHAKGHNYNTAGICLAGTDAYTLPQWSELRRTVTELLSRCVGARACGHRDLSPDKDGDGKVERHEWLKTCPGFDVTDWWLLGHMRPVPGHIIEVQQ